MVKTSKLSADLAVVESSIKAQFAGLNRNDPSSWPALPRYLLCGAVSVCVVVVLWFTWLSAFDEILVAEKVKEVQLKVEFKSKLIQAMNLEALTKQREQVQQYVIQLEKQLPSKAEMDALLSDINQAGLGRNLQFELFRPEPVVIKEYYAELPIVVRVTGRYHDIGAFVSDIANLSRIVTLNNLNISAGKDGNLVLDTTAKTFRYLDAQEVALQRKAKLGAGAPK